MVIVLLWLIPTLGVLITSFRPENLVNTTGWWTALAHPFRAAAWTLENYRLALDRGGLGNAFLNSLAVTIPSTVIPITIAAFAAYAFSWMEFKGRYVLFVVVVGLMVVPIQMTLIPLLRLFANGATIGRLIVFPDLDLNGTFMGIWLAHAGFGLPLAIYLLRSYIGSLPSSIIESAKIDGADHFTIFWRLVVPLSVPALAAFAIFQFLWVWNDLLVAYVFLGGTRQTMVLPIALAGLVGERGETWHLLTAAAFISMVLTADRVLLAAEVLRARPDGRGGEGMSGAPDAPAAATGVDPKAPRRMWRAILLSTLLLVPAYWALLIGVVSVASTRTGGVAAPGLWIACGLMLVPFVFVVLAFASSHPSAPGAVVKAMALAVAVGIPVSALAADAVTGFVAGIGAGGIVALRSDVERPWRARVLGVLVATAWAFLTIRIVPEAAVLLAPILPFTSVGLADHLVVLRRERRAALLPPTGRG